MTTTTTRTRNRASAKKAGTDFENDIAACLAAWYDPGIERRARNGAKDRGDISGWRYAGLRIVAECKNTRAMTIAPWIAEADIERLNDDAAVGLVVHKRRGKKDGLDQYVTLTMRDLLTLLTGERPL